MNEVVENEVKQELVQSDAEALAGLTAELKSEPEIKEPVKEKTEEAPALAEEKKEEAPKKPEDEIAPRPHARQETHRDFDALKTIIKTEREEREKAQKEAQEAKASLTKLETEYKGKVITKEWEEEFNQLRELRREVQLENDPEFRKEWDGKLEDVDTRAIGLLRTCNLTSDIEKNIIESGGIVAMSISPKLMTLPQFSTMTQSDFVEEKILPNLGSNIQRRRLEGIIGEGISLREQMSREIEQVKTQGSEKQKLRQKDIQDKFNSSVLATREQLGEMAKKIDYPKDATTEQKKKVDKHNALVDKAEKFFNEYMSEGSTNPAKLADAFTRAAASFALTDKLLDEQANVAEKDQRIKELEEKLEKIKASGATGKESTAPPPSSKPDPNRLMTDAEALAEAFGKK